MVALWGLEACGGSVGSKARVGCRVKGVPPIVGSDDYAWTPSLVGYIMRPPSLRLVMGTGFSIFRQVQDNY